MKRTDGSREPIDDYVLDFAIERMRSGERVAIVTLVGVEGSSPRPLGAQMAIAETGQWVDYLSGRLCRERGGGGGQGGACRGPQPAGDTTVAALSLSRRRPALQ